MFICTKKKTKCICLHTQKKEQNAYVYICKILSDIHSLTYAQKSCRQDAGSRDAYVYMRTFFFTTRKLQRADQRAESKKMHTLYIR